MQQSHPGSKTTQVTKFSVSTSTEVTDVVAEEVPLELQVLHQGRTHPVSITMRTPGRDVDLAIGFLFTEGLLPAGHTVAGGRARVRGNTVKVPWPPAVPLELKRIERHSYTSSSCGVCGKTSLEMVFQAIPFAEAPTVWTITPSLLPTLPPLLKKAQQLFATTGGIHAAGLFDPSGSLLHYAEDVGRHNALDKLIGHYYRHDLLPLDRHILLLSGRASFELIQKAAMAGIACVASVGAPSSLAVELAEDQGITLCGFLRASGFNCYSHPHRITDHNPQ
ncbi:Sulfur carrier protein FdhD [Neolewinella maritima]|uniref:Sulfur carrier protein FdhD n=1 Tax=Neolewinella maritima TaxID=1383882 RepID=A0ABM9B4H7_9BACT|nr:formate dehydrogenase accessory sulfurtransferase FdhD [Neolewinella maritima]CAH1002248.1 Sulfur carrier protein FdhD [Neolewinella maritima]